MTIANRAGAQTASTFRAYAQLKIHDPTFLPTKPLDVPDAIIWPGFRACIGSAVAAIDSTDACRSGSLAIAAIWGGAEWTSSLSFKRYSRRYKLRTVCEIVRASGRPSFGSGSWPPPPRDCRSPRNRSSPLREEQADSFPPPVAVAKRPTEGQDKHRPGERTARRCSGDAGRRLAKRCPRTKKLFTPMVR